MCHKIRCDGNLEKKIGTFWKVKKASSHGVLGQKAIAYYGGAINQSFPPTSKMSADSEIFGLTGHFLEQPMPVAPLQIYHQHRISSCTHLSLCYLKLKIPLCGLKVHVHTKGTCFRIWNTATYHKLKRLHSNAQT
jgi:hypothetical protein